MATFNLKKSAEETNEKQLDGVRDPIDGDKILDKLLDEVKLDKEIRKTTEDQLEKVRDGETKSWNNSIESQLDDQASGFAGERTGKDKHDVLPINHLEEKAHQEKVKAFNKANTGGKEADSDSTVPADPKSQLHNSPERFKGKKVKEMITASLRDADAMLYYIYRTAASEKREFTENEQKLIEGIKHDKAQLLNETL